jgi:hypothetical protein
MSSRLARVITVVDLPVLVEGDTKAALSFLSLAAEKGDVFVMAPEPLDDGNPLSDVPDTVRSWLCHASRPETQVQSPSSMVAFLSETLCLGRPMHHLDHGVLLAFATSPKHLDGAREFITRSLPFVLNKVVFGINGDESLHNLAHVYNTGLITKFPRLYETKEGVGLMARLHSERVAVPWRSIAPEVLSKTVAKTIKSRVKTARSALLS